MKNVVMKLFATFVVALAVPFLGNAEGLNRLGEPDYGGNWWNPSLNGMGVKVNVQNGVLDADWFAYNTRGDPIFLNFAGPLKKNAQGQDFYSGSLNIIRGSPPNTYQTHALLLNPAGPGSVTLTFADLQHATMIYRYTDPVDGSTQAGTLELTPYQYGCNLPAMWDGAFCVIPMGVKAMGVNQLPQGCNSWKDQCWRDAIKNGTVKLIATSAKMTGYNDRPVMFAYFRNNTAQFGVNGLWEALAIYADDASMIGIWEIGGGSGSEIDWVYGTSQGVITHQKSTNECFHTQWDVRHQSWDVNGTGIGTAVPCP